MMLVNITCSKIGTLLPVAYQGPRFGVRAVSHPGGGVRITEIVPNAPGGRAGFEIGDVILDINGTPIRNEQDYSKAIDDSPQTITVKV
ncbi:MAG: PDZ domain-containing protein, partial [Planctomycetaceae bacterium]|nr:PDZ domain-containing protein [Planctomycetaceae bacterium]